MDNIYQYNQVTYTSYNILNSILTIIILFLLLPFLFTLAVAEIIMVICIFILFLFMYSIEYFQLSASDVTILLVATLCVLLIFKN